jgi:hypothetical protein
MDLLALPHEAPAAVAPVLVGRSEFPLRVFFGHHKCATGWIDHILMEICFHMGIRFYMAHVPAHFEPFGSIGGLVGAKKIDFLAYTNADSRYLDRFAFYKAFHVVRDPRDVLVSAYFSHRHSHSTQGWPELAAHREVLNRVSKEEGLFLELEFSRPSFEEFDRWDYTQPNILELKMEALSAAPLDGFLRIARYLDILDEERYNALEELSIQLNTRMNRLNHKGRRFMPAQMPMFPVPRIPRYSIRAELIRRILEKKSFQRMSGGRKAGEEDVKNHFRKGVPGDWRNHFTPALTEAFKYRYNAVVLKLGYETDEDWR